MALPIVLVYYIPTSSSWRPASPRLFCGFSPFRHPRRRLESAALASERFRLPLSILPGQPRVLFRDWSTRGLRRLIPALMVFNIVAAVLIAMQLLPLLGLSIAYLHRWAPFRMPQFIIGI